MPLHADHAIPSSPAHRTATCQAFAGSLVAACPNPATDTTVVRGRQRAVCPAHAPFRFPHQHG